MNKEKLHLGLICFAVLVVFSVAVMITKENGIVLGRNIPEKERPLQWQNMIAADVNSGKIDVNVDGEDVTVVGNNVYMTDNLNIMLPVNLLGRYFKCAVNKFNGDSMTLQKGDIVVNINKTSAYIDKNGEIIDMLTPMTIEDGTAYINALILEKCFGYSYDWDCKVNKLVLENMQHNNILPAKYSYRTNARIGDIKNQGSLNTCWAFSAITALETSLMPFENHSFSIDNMVGNSGFSLTAKDGGDYNKAMAYLTSWYGPVAEEQDIYADGIINKNASVLKHVQEVQIIENKNIEEIKEAVFLYGGVQTSVYTSMKKAGQHSMYYNENTSAYCYNGKSKPNHSVTIVGWDDEYSKDNFTVSVAGDGAFICANSWGEKFGDNGFFYVSYYDSNIGTNNVVYTRVDDTDVYDNIYQSDLCGWVGQLGYGEEEAYFANVYQANGIETLEAVGFYATGKDATYEISIVENFNNEGSLNNRRIIKSGRFENAGFYTVDFDDLDEKIMLSKSVKYAIIVKIKTPGSVHPIAIEYKSGKNTKNVVLEDGEGYISLYGNSWERVESTKQCNICLKMYTKNLE